VSVFVHEPATDTQTMLPDLVFLYVPMTPLPTLSPKLAKQLVRVATLVSLRTELAKLAAFLLTLPIPSAECVSLNVRLTPTSMETPTLAIGPVSQLAPLMLTQTQ
jgi:hypothetical protein